MPSEKDDDETYFRKLDVLSGKRTADIAQLTFAPKQRETREEQTWDASEMTALPPCLSAIAQDLAAGKHVGHKARFNLAAFLVKRDAAPEDIHRFFVNAPNYKPEMTSMQIDSIRRGRDGRSYAPDGCDSMRKLGLCRMDAICQERCVTTPLQYPRSAA